MMKISGTAVRISVLALLLLGRGTVCAAPAVGGLPSVGGIPVDFLLFGLTLLGVAIFHHHTLRVALIGVVTITGYKLCLPVSNPAPAWPV